MAKQTRRRYIGDAPKACDLCGSNSTVKAFVDGRTKHPGYWASMCVPCHKEQGVGLGTGAGQRYEAEQDADGKTAYYKTAG